MQETADPKWWGRTPYPKSVRNEETLEKKRKERETRIQSIRTSHYGMSALNFRPVSFFPQSDPKPPNCSQGRFLVRR